MLLIYAIGCNKKGVLVNVATQKISKLSLEIYLSHMLMYRILEKLRLIHLFESELLSYIFISSLTIIGTICFVVVVRYGLKVSARVIRRGI